MKTSETGLNFIINEEGFVDHVYPDQFGYPTVGIGHLLTDGEKASGAFAKGVTRDQALALFRVDVRRFEAIVDELVAVPLTQPQYDALVSLCFNIGRGSPGDHRRGFYESTVRRLLNQCDYVGAAGAFWMWRRGGERSEILGVLVKRRERERSMFLSGTTQFLGDPETAPDLRDPFLSEPSFPKDPL